MSRTKRAGSSSVRRAAAMLLAVLMIISLCAPGAFAAGAVKKTAKRAIGIVYDNSASMYYKPNATRWCIAIYAMEVFASMLNEGDVLQIYPMNPIEVQGSTYDYDHPMEIKNKNEVSRIREIYSPMVECTYIATIPAAFRGLQNTNADEKWLIVLTDGAEFTPDTGTMDNMSAAETKVALTEMLTEYNDTVNVAYLGIDIRNKNYTPTITGTQKNMVLTAAAAEVPDVLNSICNSIFGRDEIPRSGNNLSFDVPLSKLIIFVQGKDVSNVTLGSITPTSSYSPRYSEKGAGINGYNQTRPRDQQEIDTSLQGNIATFENVKAGDYTISYTVDGNSAVSVYYEPDVDLAAVLVDSNGQIADPSGELYSGTYTVKYGLADGEGNFTESSLLGKQDFNITYTVNGEKKTVKSSKPGEFTLDLKAGDELDLDIDATFLSGYQIHKSGIDFGWPQGGLHIATRPAGSLGLNVSGGQDRYELPTLEKDAVYTFTVSKDGQKLTGEALQTVEFDVALAGGNALAKLDKSNDSATITINYAGSAAETQPGRYSLTVTASSTNEDGQKATSNKIQKTFTINQMRSVLTLNMDYPQKYFVISSIGKTDPIHADLKIDGKSLTEAQMKDASLSIEAEDGLVLKATPISDGSGFLVDIDPASNIKSGKYKVKFNASAKDEIGQTITASDSVNLEFGRIPMWMKLVAAALAVALLATLIILFMNMKVLPKEIVFDPTGSDFKVGGHRIDGKHEIHFEGKGKKSGTIRIKSPNHPTNFNAKVGVELTVRACSPRKTKSAKRKVLVESARITGGGVPKDIALANREFEFVKGKLYSAGTEQFKEFVFGNGGVMDVTCNVKKKTSGTEKASLVTKLKFK